MLDGTKRGYFPVLPSKTIPALDSATPRTRSEYSSIQMFVAMWKHN